MTAMARLLVIMGSGETSPTMSKVHRDLLDRVGPGPAVMLDTPFGFQENADDISSKALAYFKGSVQRELVVASFRAAEGADPLAYETTLARLREAVYVFAGPGSPSYALAQWSASKVPAVLTQTLRAMERDGLVARRVHAEVPPRVEYALTSLGASMAPPLKALGSWSLAHGRQVEEARDRFDARAARAKRAA